MIGMSTEIGKIQAQIQSAAEEEDDSPLKKNLDEFGELLAKVLTELCAFALTLPTDISSEGLHPVSGGKDSRPFVFNSSCTASL